MQTLVYALPVSLGCTTAVGQTSDKVIGIDSWLFWLQGPWHEG